jgi:hypothetical protein
LECLWKILHCWSSEKWEWNGVCDFLLRNCDYCHCHTHTHTGWSKCLCAPDDYIQKIRKNTVVETDLITCQDNVVRIRDNRTQFGVSINVWRLAGDTLNITWNFLFCNHQVHKRLFDHSVYEANIISISGSKIRKYVPHMYFAELHGSASNLCGCACRCVCVCVK